MIHLILLLLLMPIWGGPIYPEGEILSGTFSQYGELPSTATIEYRDSVGQLPANVNGYIAVSSCDHIGDRAWISIDYGPWLRVGVADCAGSAETVEWMAKDRIIGELFYDLALSHDTIGRGIKGRLILD